MRYKLTKETLPRVTELCQLIEKTRASLAGFGPEGHREWDRLRPRFPSNEDLYQGYISLSAAEVEELYGKLVQFGGRAAPAPAVLRPRTSSTRLPVPVGRPVQPAA